MKKSLLILTVFFVGALAQWGCASGDGPDAKVNNPNVTSDPTKPASPNNVGQAKKPQTAL